MQNFARFMGIPALALIATVLMASNPPSVAAEGDGMLYLVKFEGTEGGSPAPCVKSAARSNRRRGVTSLRHSFGETRAGFHDTAPLCHRRIRTQIILTRLEVCDIGSGREIRERRLIAAQIFPLA